MNRLSHTLAAARRGSVWLAAAAVLSTGAGVVQAQAPQPALQAAQRDAMATIRYVAVIRNGTLNEVGDRLVPGQPPQRFFEMNLVRVSDNDWPEAGAVPPR